MGVRLQATNKPILWDAYLDEGRVGYVVKTDGMWPFLAIPIGGAASECSSLEVARDYLERTRVKVVFKAVGG